MLEELAVILNQNIFVVGLVALGLGAGCAPAAVHEPVTPSTTSADAPAPKASAKSKADACPSMGPILRRQQSNILEHSSRMVNSGRGLTGVLSALHGLEAAFNSTSSDLSQAYFVNAESGKDALTAAKELGEAKSELERSRTLIEGGVRKAATPLREAREKAWELRSICEGISKPTADCKAIMKSFSDAELATWTTKPAIDAAATKTGKIVTKDAGRARELATVKEKLVATSSALTELDAINLDDAQERIGTHTKAAMEAIGRIQKQCGEDTKLAPVDWIASPAGTDPRKLTVLVVGILPDSMKKIFDAEGEKKGDLTSGSSGSGFVVVREIAKKRRAFVVTNRHVVTHSLRAKILLDGSEKMSDANVVYVDPHHDVAVLELAPGADGTLPFQAGLTLETNPPADQQQIVAAGFPGMGDRPSYQVTRGYISNHKVQLGDTEVAGYIQHTAPTDPGSSGGPLLSEAGRLLGVNTLKMRGREGVALAVPADIVVDAVRAAESPPKVVAQDARFACLATLADLSTRQTSSQHTAANRLSANFVAEVGPASFNRTLKNLPANDQSISRLYYMRDPLGVLHWATLDRLQEAMSNAGGVSELEMCESVTMNTSGDDASLARFIIQTVRGPRELKLTRERGGWTVASYDFRDAPLVPTKANPKKKSSPPGVTPPQAPATPAAPRAKTRRAVDATR